VVHHAGPHYILLFFLSTRMIPLGLWGVGHLGKIHLKLLKESPDFKLVGFYDADPSVAEEVSAETGVPAFPSSEALMNEVEAADVVIPTLQHFELAKELLRQSKHVFIEKPLATTSEEADKLVELRHEAGVIGQVGHVERFNPAFLAAQELALKPMFLEVHRLALWNPRGTDVSVVSDLMIHDIDLVLTLVDSGIKRIAASGVAVITDTPDIANARIEFHNGAVANLTASRISAKNMRKMRLFQPSAYVSIDFLEKQVEVMEILDEVKDHQPSLPIEAKGKTRYLTPRQMEVQPVNAIMEELAQFAAAIRGEQDSAVSFHDAYRALETAEQIASKIKPLAV